MTETDEVTVTTEPVVAVLADDEMHDEVPDRLLHKRGCPKDRIESYTAIRPGIPAEGIPPREITVQRCIECGNQHVKEQ